MLWCMLVSCLVVMIAFALQAACLVVTIAFALCVTASFLCVADVATMHAINYKLYFTVNIM